MCHLLQEIRAFAESERVAVLSAEAAVALELPVSREMEMVANVDPQVSAGHISAHQKQKTTCTHTKSVQACRTDWICCLKATALATASCDANCMIKHPVAHT